jgi:hypothetical protein
MPPRRPRFYGVAPVLKAFRDKYGDKNVATYYPKTDVAVEAPT